jgi:predicted metal-dependent hydrolase
MHLYVKPPDGHVTVSAPLSMSDVAIERFVRTKTTWIKKQIAKFDNQLRQSEREYISGETLYVWGKQYYFQTEYGNKNLLVLSGDKAVLTVRKESDVKQRERFVREWYRKLLKTEITRLLPKWEKTTGLKASGWQTKYMTTRWGTCNTKTGKIWLNLQLAKKTSECLEYVILHELIHLVEKKHDEKFVALMDKYMPMWREIKATLNGQTLDYME